MMRSLFSGVSGLKTHQTKMDVIGNNISNVNTVAFKSSSTTFQDLMYQTTSNASGATATRGGTNAKQIGLGVTNGATKISITGAGAAQSTSDALDIRLTDSNSTNFFIVSNGTENLFTRAGSFYIDGNGNLAMTTTGYLVMGWQVDEETGTIKQDTVSALRVMQADNLTSAPEATSQATVSGVIDKNDSQFTTDTGYIRSLTFYDNLGYSYTAKFSIKITDADNGVYSIELTDVLDSNGKSVLDAYTNVDGQTLSDIFGTTHDTTKTYNISNTAVSYSNGTYTYVSNGVTYTATMDDTYDSDYTDDDGNAAKYTAGLTFSATGYSDVNLSFGQMFGVSTDVLKKATLDTSSTGQLLATYETTDYAINFDATTGKLSSVGTDGGTSLTFAGHLLSNQVTDADGNLVTSTLSDIVIDFSTLLMYDNGGTSTVTIERGGANGTDGAGKKLGTMTGLSISSNGEIYGAYSNGNTVLLGQIAVAQFANASGLEEVGDNCYKTTLNSGDFDGIGLDISADGSSMNTGQLEMSNVDLSSEFTEMIVTQRGFQANSRIITVSDTLLGELINLKR